MKKVFTSSLLILFLILVALFSWYSLSTTPASECEQYCIEKSKRGATNFEPFADDRYTKRYTYWVAVDGDPTKPQEVFIFRLKTFLSIDFNRYQYIASSVASDAVTSELPIGSMQFYTMKDNGEKETGSTLLLYGSHAEADIYYCEYKVKYNNKIETIKNAVLGRSADKKAWLCEIYDLGADKSGCKKEIFDIKFYDINNKLLYKY